MGKKKKPDNLFFDDTFRGEFPDKIYAVPCSVCGERNKDYFGKYDEKTKKTIVVCEKHKYSLGRG